MWGLLISWALLAVAFFLTTQAVPGIRVTGGGSVPYLGAALGFERHSKGNGIWGVNHFHKHAVLCIKYTCTYRMVVRVNKPELILFARGIFRKIFYIEID